MWKFIFKKLEENFTKKNLRVEGKEGRRKGEKVHVQGKVVKQSEKT